MFKDCIYKNIFYRKNDFKKGRRTLFFVHGLSSNISAWAKFEKKFAKRYNIILIDLRGHGKSFKFSKYEDYSIDKFSQDIYSLFIHENISKATLICHSLGVLVGLDFIRKNQKLLNSAVLLSPSYAPAAGGLSRLNKALLTILKQILILTPTIKIKGEHFDYGPYEGTGDYNLRRLYRDITNTGIKAYVFSSIHALNFNAKSHLKNIKIPVLLIQGDRDTILSGKECVIMNKEIKKSKLFIINDADHTLVLNNFDEISKIISDFI